MGLGSSAFERDKQAETTWIVPHGPGSTPWSRFASCKYDGGFAATGVSTNVAVPRLTRRSLQDWSVKGCSVRLGADFVSFGRQLESLSRSGADLFYGIDIFFGNHQGGSWFWYCRASEWKLQLHKAILEALPAQQSASDGAAPGVTSTSSNQRFPGRPRYLGEESSASESVGPKLRASSSSVAAPSAPAPASSADASTPAPSASSTAAAPAGNGEDPVEHQLALFFSNADGHVGQLCLPVPRSRVAETQGIVSRWDQSDRLVPLFWAERRWQTTEDFARLRETSLNMPDLLLFGLETELAMALTPDWTWEKYPQGFGEAAVPEQRHEDAEAEAADMAAALAASQVDANALAEGAEGAGDDQREQQYQQRAVA